METMVEFLALLWYLGALQFLGVIALIVAFVWGLWRLMRWARKKPAASRLAWALDRLRQRKRWLTIRALGKRSIGWDYKYDQEERDALAYVIGYVKKIEAGRQDILSQRRKDAKVGAIHESPAIGEGD
jgi:hypothetical protein